MKSLVVFLIATRLAVFFLAIQRPFPLGQGGVASPSLVGGADLPFYQDAAQKMFKEGNFFKETYHTLVKFYSGEAFRGMVAGPVFPFLIWAADYREGHTLALALFFMAVEIAMAWGWLGWLREQGLSGVWLYLFPCLPYSLYFMIAVGSDLLFAAFFSGFFVTYFFKSDQAFLKIPWWVVFLALMILTRPNGMSVLLFVMMDRLFFNARGPHVWRTVGLAAAAFSGCAVVFWPYFAVVSHSTADVGLFGIKLSTYWSGLFPSWPMWLDRPLSLLALAGAKICYLFGIRPSYSGLPTWLVALRMLMGLGLAMGMMELLRNGSTRLRWLMGVFLAPVLAAWTQERLILPIIPILFFYFVQFLNRIRFQRDLAPG